MRNNAIIYIILKHESILFLIVITASIVIVIIYELLFCQLLMN